MNGITQSPVYLELLDSGELAARVDAATAMLQPCRCCARQCKVSRLNGELGACKIGEQSIVYLYGPHMGEEDPIRGWQGSGTIFFSGCNLNCVYCQNFEISQQQKGEITSAKRLAEIMLELQDSGCHNVNLVSPSHVVPQILGALLIAAKFGLCIPIVYNSGGYDSLEMLQVLDGIIDIYMPDMKYANSSRAYELSGVPRYPQVNKSIVHEMYRQVGDLQINRNGLAERGLLIRHLVLPNNLSGTDQVVRFIAKEISSSTYTNIMGQYHPAYRAKEFPSINRRTNQFEYHRALDWAMRAGLWRMDDPQPSKF